MEPTDWVDKIMKLGFTGASVLVNILLVWRLLTVEKKLEDSTNKRFEEKDSILDKLLHQPEAR